MIASLRIVWTGLVGLAALFCGAWALIGLAGAVVPQADAVNHLAPIALGGSLLVAALATSVRRRAGWILGVALVACLYQAWRVVPELVAPRAPASSEAPADLTLVSFNVLGWKLQEIDPALRWIIAQDPDLIAIQETEGKGRELTSALQAAGWRNMVCPHTRNCGTALLSRKPPLESSSDDPSRRISAAWASYQLRPGITYSAISVHLSWPLNRPVTDWPPRHPFQARQMARLARLVEERGRAPVLVSGDFNSTPWSFALDGLVRAAGLQRHSRANFSWPVPERMRLPVPGPVLPIDHLLTGSHWQVLSFRRGPALGSDHYPFVARLVWTGPELERATAQPRAAREGIASAAVQVR